MPKKILAVTIFRHFLWTFLLTGWVALSAAGPIQAGEKANRPNILFILVDDLGWADLGCYGNRFNETPNIDKLAANGMRFTHYYTAGAVCSPTRASIMSGQYQARFGLTAHIPGHWRPFAKLAEPPCALNMPLSIRTIAEALGNAGYTTAHFGKWHLGGGGHMPKDQGFHESIVTSGRHEYPKFRTSPPMKIEKGTRLTDFLTDQAITFMQKHRDQPFFIHLSHYAVHIPLDTTPELQKKYEAKPKVKNYPCNPTYAGLLEEVDRSVGRLVAALEELDLADNTLIFFTSDNGGLIMRYDGSEIVCSNFPLRSEKGSLYEGGVRVPLIVSWPGVTKAGSLCEETTISVDFYQTFLQLAGAKAQKDQVLDGVSLVPLLKSPTAHLERQALYWHYPHYHHSRPSSSIRMGDWKAIEFFDTGKVELYNLKKDLSQKKNLATNFPEKVAQLQEMLRQWRDEVNAQMPRLNPAFNPKREGEWWSRRTVTPISKKPKR